MAAKLVYHTTTGWHFTNDDCARARECVCGFCKADGMCDFGDCRRPATTRLVGQGTSRPACDRCASPGAMARLCLGYKPAAARSGTSAVTADDFDQVKAAHREQILTAFGIDLDPIEQAAWDAYGQAVETLRRNEEAYGRWMAKQYEAWQREMNEMVAGMVADG